MKQADYERVVAGHRVGDPINDLGCQLRRQIPEGEARQRWLGTSSGRQEAIGALRNAGYTGNLLARAMFDLSYGEIRLPLTIQSPAELAALEQ